MQTPVEAVAREVKKRVFLLAYSHQFAVKQVLQAKLNKAFPPPPFTPSSVQCGLHTPHTGPSVSYEATDFPLKMLSGAALLGISKNSLKQEKTIYF